MKFIIVVNRGAVTRGGGGGGGNVISTEGNTRALHFSPAPAGPDFFSSDASRACFRLLLILIF